MREGQGERQGSEKLVRFGTYNIQRGRNRGLGLALCGLVQGQVDCVVLQETNITDRVYTRESSGFRVTATVASIPHCRCVAVFYRKAEHLTIEELRLQSQNIIRL